MEFSITKNDWGFLRDSQVQSTNSASQQQVLQSEIEKCKAKYNSILKDKDDLVKAKLEVGKVTAEYNAKIQMYQQNLWNDIMESSMQDIKYQEKLKDIDKEIEIAIKDQDTIKENLANIDERKAKMEWQLKISSCMPEKRWVFTGQEIKDNEQEVKFDVKPKIQYPIKGGCALITFDDVKVAGKILEMENHKIEIGECSINIKARPMQLPTVEEIEIQTQVSKHCVLISEIPKFLPTMQLLDKLELHFSKPRNNGGEVDKIEMLEDSGNVVITFVEEGISEKLTNKGFHQVSFRGIDKTATLKVSPFINGEIERIKVGEIISKKSVLLTGIPDILDEENFKDYLQIHFQKASNGGGEVDAIIYIPEGKSAITCFEEDNEEISEDP
ncbi:interferon-induced 35 kDa protein [Narcine bancroftii]|uniref:interferon-induced 35 kDa protein n=1 Tax=Narcine bancroftii TaxID=1343680 RepID=UPI0038320452